MSRNFVIKRILISVMLGLLIGVAVSEVPFLFLRETARPPREVVLTIPAGTSDQIARGEQPPSIPENMTFVVGDTLVVKNEDRVDHKLGPLWIPANSSAQLSLDQEENLAYECSFQPGKYFGLDVRQPLTPRTRLYGIFYVAVPMMILIALYSLVVSPQKNDHAPA
ncbi:MAG TPA: hypothetical protein VFY83_11555 [Anaerolineales bacterium]|jgi:hypothetical protein|nr:hypothetical protein [Anaerolineales bacterium]